MPGPKTILSVLGQDPDLVASGPRLPRSTRTMWQILTRSGRIAHPPVRAHDRLDLPPPLTAWHRDVKDISTVPGAPAGKRQHVVETRNAIDMGTSILLQAEVRDDVTAETAVTAVAHLLQQQGLPQRLTIDRDPRFVGSHTGRDFPSPFIRFLTCLGGEVTGCPPHRPAKNAFGERLPSHL